MTSSRLTVADDTFLRRSLRRQAISTPRIAKGRDTAKRDIDLMVVSDSLSYAGLFAILEEATNRLGRTVNPTVYSRRELDRRVRAGNAFIKRVLEQLNCG